jgi:hypothetical protein
VQVVVPVVNEIFGLFSPDDKEELIANGRKGNGSARRPNLLAFAPLRKTFRYEEFALSVNSSTFQYVR